MRNTVAVISATGALFRLAFTRLAAGYFSTSGAQPIARASQFP
jgi:hypothetical protein